MSKAVENERLAVRQRLIDVYQQDLTGALQKANEIWQKDLAFQDKMVAEEGALGTFDALVSRDYDGAIIYDKTRERIYPLFSTDVNGPVELEDTFAEAWQLEFVEQDFSRAAERYEQRAKSENPYVKFTALIGKSRVLAKLGKLETAISTCKKAAFSSKEKSCDVATLALIANARLLLMELLKQNIKDNESLILEAFVKLVEIIHEQNEAGCVLPSEQRIFLARRILKLYEESPFLKSQPRSLDEEGIQKLIAAEELSMRMVARFPAVTALSNWQNDQLRGIEHEKKIIYGMRHEIDGRTALLLQNRESAARSLLYCNEETFKDSDVDYRVIDDSGRLVTGLAQPKGSPFVTAFVGEHFPGWKTELYFQNGDVFEKAASKQVALYTWAAALVIVLILAAGGFAGQVVGRQIKLNRLKNDFIATVSHELRTPLASMRVLVDTLLEGRYKDQEQATEYLELVSKENVRLSRLIDNFLTFSRMERNKQAFEMVKVSPAAIAHRAAEAVKTKFEQGRCKFNMSIDEKLPDVLADQDAMVTAIVNLLDNAYKYSYDDKQIRLRVFTEDGSVCFRVSDNGIGLSRRAAKRIFKRFYQVDRSLSRHTEGCGLGLSIVKFIVDAHKGQITVDSRVDKGSTFTIKLPVIDKTKTHNL